jgi:hypothetical protein
MLVHLEPLEMLICRYIPGIYLVGLAGAFALAGVVAVVAAAVLDAAARISLQVGFFDLLEALAETLPLPLVQPVPER